MEEGTKPAEPATEPQAEPSPPPAEPQQKISEPRHRKFSFKKFNQKLTLTISIIFKLGGFGLVILLVVLFWKQFSYEGYSLEEVHVPEIFEKAGYSGVEVAVAVESYISQARKTAHFQYLDFSDDLDDVDYLLDDRKSELEVNMVGVALPLHALFNFVGNSFGINKSKRVTAFLTMSSGNVNLILYIRDHQPEIINANLDSLGVENAVNYLTKEAAEYILGISNPELLAQYQFSKNEHPDKVIQICEFAINHSNDTVRNKFNYGLWGRALMRKGDYAGAAEKFKKSIASDPKTIGTYFGLVVVLQGLARWDESKIVLQKAAHILEHKKLDKKRKLSLEYFLDWQMTAYYLQKKDIDSVHLWYSKLFSNVAATDERIWDDWGFTSTSKDFAIALRDRGLEGEGKMVLKKAVDLAKLKYGDETALKKLESPFYQFIWEDFLAKKNYDSAYLWQRRLTINFLSRNELNNLAFALSEHGQYDSALHYAQKAVSADSSDPFPYSTIAEIFAYQKNREQFYFFLAKSLERGLNAKELSDRNAPYSNFREEKRFKELLKKYSK